MLTIILLGLAGPVFVSVIVIYGSVTALVSLSSIARLCVITLAAAVGFTATQFGAANPSHWFGQLIGFAFWVPPIFVVPAALVAVPAWIALKYLVPTLSDFYRWAVIGVLTMGVITVLHISTLDGLVGATYGLLLPDDTEYTASYSANAFRRVAVGMTEEQVQALLGAPLDKGPVFRQPARIGWWWSHSPHDSHYRVRAVTFEGGVVVGKDAYLHLD
jgi:hypothetical protein